MICFHMRVTKTVNRTKFDIFVGWVEVTKPLGILSKDKQLMMIKLRINKLFSKGNIVNVLLLEKCRCSMGSIRRITVQ